MEIRTKKRVTLLLTAVALLFMVGVTLLVGIPMVRFVSDPEQFRLWVDAHGIGSRVVFVAMMMFQILLAFIPGEPLEIGAGYAFGGVEGTLLCLIATTLGGAILFWLVRRFGVKYVELFFSMEKIRSLKFLQNEKRLNVIVFIIFFVPGTPKDLLSYFVGLTPMKFSTWMIITSLARLPSIVTSTFGGDALHQQDYVRAVLVFSITLVVAAVGWFAYGKYSKWKQNKEEKDG